MKKFEVLFRGNRFDNADLIEGFYFVHGVSHYIKNNGNYEVVPESIGMFTGEVDCNKEKIFGSIPINGEMSKGGDEIAIYSADGEEFEYSKVEFKEGGFIVEADFGDFDQTTIGWANLLSYKIEITKKGML